MLGLTKELCDIKQVSNYLDVSVPYLRKLVRAKMIPHYKFGNRIKFDIKEINEWVENNKVEMKKSILLY